MNFNEYQDRAAKLAIYPKEAGPEYTALGLTSEAGEVAGKVKKQIRDGHSWTGEEREAKRHDIKAEAGDVLWYLSELVRQYGFTLEEVALYNIKKLESRKTRGVLAGDGDNR